MKRRGIPEADIKTKAIIDIADAGPSVRIVCLPLYQDWGGGSFWALSGLKKISGWGWRASSAVAQVLGRLFEGDDSRGPGLPDTNPVGELKEAR